MKDKETIKLMDFVADYVKAFDIDEDDFKPSVGTYKQCPVCKRTYDNDSKTQFCSIDGKELEIVSYEYLSEETREEISHIFHFLSNNLKRTNEYTEEFGKFPYIFEDAIEKRGDGDGYYMNYIFKRKSDGKFFVYTSYEGRIEEDTLDETTKVVKVKWDFERYFN